jgi:hypothetical protein
MDGKISDAGDSAEQLFDKLVTSSRKTDNSAKGDRIVTVDGEDYYVEIKKCGALLSKRGTINQIRPIKYIPLVIWASGRSCWFIFSPEKLIEIALEKKRGQHNEVSFECINLTLRVHNNGLTEFKCLDQELQDRLYNCIRNSKSSSKSNAYRDRMAILKTELQAIARQCKKDITNIQTR